MVPDQSNLHLYSDFADGQPPSSELARRQDKCNEKRQQETKKYKLALTEASLLHKEVCHGDKNIVPIFWGVTREQDRCQICGSVEDPLDSLLLCDQCDTPWHMQCLKPPLRRVPDGDWFCPDCVGRVVRRTSVLDELYSLRDQAGVIKLKRPRSGTDMVAALDVPPPSAYQDVASGGGTEARRYRTKRKDKQSLLNHDDFSLLFAVSQQYRPLPCVHDAPPGDTCTCSELNSNNSHLSLLFTLYSDLAKSPRSNNGDLDVDIDIDDAVNSDVDDSETVAAPATPPPLIPSVPPIVSSPVLHPPAAPTFHRAFPLSLATNFISFCDACTGPPGSHVVPGCKHRRA